MLFCSEEVDGRLHFFTWVMWPPSCHPHLGFHGTIFFNTFLLTSSPVLFRILLYGIIRTIRPSGPLDGLLGGRFIVAFLSVLGILWAKGAFIAVVVVAYTADDTTLSLSTATMIIVLQFVPQIILSVFTTIGFSLSSMKLILYHPETLILPSGTNFKIFFVKLRSRSR